MAEMEKESKNTTREVLSHMLQRMKMENEALQHLINALNEQHKSVDKKS